MMYIKNTNMHKRIISVIIVCTMLFGMLATLLLNSKVEAASYRYTYDGTNLDTNTYKGFKEKIDALKAVHPNWNFVIMETGLDWNQVIVAEKSGCGERSPRSLIQDKTGDWVCPTCGTRGYDNGSWYHASEFAIKYYMDPRNWLNDNAYIFQFLQLGYAETTDADVYNALNGTFLYTMDIARAIHSGCKAKGANPYFVIARIIQEQGYEGDSSWQIQDSNGTMYYNLFNINASGNSVSEINANSLSYAKSHGWDTIQKSIEGGIEELFSGYLEYKQDTLYLNKFDVESYEGLYWNQYMQNIEAPKDEAQIMYNKIKNTAIMSSNLTFVIPLYYNMDSSAASTPSASIETSVKNIKLKSGHTEWNIRASTSTSSDILGEVADSNTIVLSVQRYNDGWHRIVLTNGTVGYIKFDPDAWEETNDVTNCSESVVLTGDDVRLRVGPKLSETEITTLSKGQIVTRIDNTGRYNLDGYIWDRVRLSDGRQGFVVRNYLQSATSEDSETFFVKVNDILYLRSTPNGNIIRSLGNGTRVTRTEVASSQVDGYYWDKIITPDGAIGYVARSYLRDANGNIPGGKAVTAGERAVKKDDNSNIIYAEPNVEFEDLKEFGNITVKDKNNSAITSGKIGTGYKVIINNKEYTVIKKGDVNGDGYVDTGDTFMITKKVLNLINITDEHIRSAADVNNDGYIDTGDTFIITKRLLRLTEIKI